MPPTDEQQRNRERAVENIDADLRQDSGITPVRSTDLLPSPSLDFNVPQTEPPFPVAALQVSTPPLGETGPEREAQSLTEELQALNEGLLGESAFRTQREEEQGIAAKTQLVQDLESRFNTLAAEAQAIPLQLQQEFEGRGVTKGGLAPIQTSRLRANAIQALGAKSLLEAAQGNLTTAFDLVDRAVAQEFDPIREEILTKQANLQLILQSPDFTRADKNRAQAQLDAQNNQLAALSEQENEKKAIGQAAIDAINAGADGLMVRRIQSAQSAAEAQQLLAQVTSAQAQAAAQLAAVDTAFERGLDERRVSATERGLDLEAGRLQVSREELEQRAQGGPDISTAQAKAAGYALRLDESSDIIGELGEKFVGFASRASGAVPKGLQSEDRQKFDQAIQNFINAKLREESGAAIAPTEFEKADLQYIPVPGDKPETLKQKARNRLQAIESMKLESGPGFDILKEKLPPLDETVDVGGTEYPVGTILENASGQRGRVESDGTITPL